ncbi:MAG: hypothetical protein P4L33_13970 [Capsulimonadaceae bacterium]|nr:hypothetical protein [Capsulimonadaceae bacterium]
MIDLHNHILPALDDGARDLAEALAIAKMAVEAGTTVMAATPHRYMRGREIMPATIVSQVGVLQDELEARSIPLTIIPGCEIPIAVDIVEKLAAGRLLRIGGSAGTHALVETPFENIPPYALSVLEDLFDAGVQVVLAHPERNVQVQNDLAFVESAAALGCVLQVTSGSILGHFGPRAEAAARAIVSRDDWQVVIASDAHWAHDRTPNHLVAASERVAEWTGNAARACAMIADGPAACLPAYFRQAA